MEDPGINLLYEDPLSQIVGITKTTIDRMLKGDNQRDLLAVYIFYCYTAKWQGTNQPKCTTGYTAKGLGMSETKVREAKKGLKELGLIEDVKNRDAKTNKITGWYIKIIYLIGQEYLSKNINPHSNDFVQGGKDLKVENRDTNALSTSSLNALSTSKENALSTSSADTNIFYDEDVKDDVKQIFEYFNKQAGKSYNYKSKSNKKLILPRLKEGYKLDDFKRIIYTKTKQWKDDPEMKKYLRPSTLFAPNHFEDYLNEDSDYSSGEQKSIKTDPAVSEYSAKMIKAAHLKAEKQRAENIKRSLSNPDNPFTQKLRADHDGK